MLTLIYTTATELQRNFKKVAKKARNVEEGVVVLSNSRPVGIYTDYAKYMSKMNKKRGGKSDLLSLVGTMSAKEADKLNKDIDKMNEQIDSRIWKWAE